MTTENIINVVVLIVMLTIGGFIGQVWGGDLIEKYHRLHPAPDHSTKLMYDDCIFSCEMVLERVEKERNSPP